MGLILEPTPAMGEYRVEVRRESFYLHGEGGSGDHGDHAITVYPDTRDESIGTVEILLEDIPKIRACLDAIEAHLGQSIAPG